MSTQDIAFVRKYFTPLKCKPYMSILPTIPEEEVISFSYLPLTIHRDIMRLEKKELNEIYKKMHMLTSPQVFPLFFEKHQYLMYVYLKQMEAIEEKYQRKRYACITRSL